MKLFIFLSLIFLIFSIYLGSRKASYAQSQTHKSYQEVSEDLQNKYREQKRRERAQKLLLDEQNRKKELVAEVTRVSSFRKLLTDLIK